MNVVSFYRFADVDDPPVVRGRLKALCDRNRLLGTILVAPEEEASQPEEPLEAETVREPVVPEEAPPAEPGAMPESYRQALGGIKGRVVESDGQPVADIKVGSLMIGGVVRGNIEATGAEAIVDATAFGYPIRSLAGVPATCPSVIRSSGMRPAARSRTRQIPRGGANNNACRR